MSYPLLVRVCNYGLGCCLKIVEDRALTWGEIVVERNRVLAFVMLDRDGGRQ